MLRSRDKQLWLPSLRRRQPANPVLGLPGAPGLASAFTGEVDWLRVKPPVAGYTSWYDCADIATIDAGPVGGGADVGLMFNKVRGAGKAAFQNTGGNRPTFGTRKIGRHYALDLNGTSGYLNGQTGEMPTRPMTAVVLYDADSISVNNRFLLHGSAAAGKIGLYIDSTGGHLQSIIGGVAVYDSGFAASTGVHISGLHLDTSTQFTFLHDGAFSTVSSSASTSAGGLVIGQYGDGGGNTFDGAIGEVLIWDVALTQAQMTLVYEYLRKKWGV